MVDLIGLDFETYGGVDLPTHGLDRYVSDPTFRPLLADLTKSDEFSLGVQHTRLDWVLGDPDEQRHKLAGLIGDASIVAHNAGFERAVLASMGLHYRAERFIDSAVLARAAGAASRLEAAAPQLLDADKVEAGKNLMRLFSIPGKYQEASGNLEFDPQVVLDHRQEWDEYADYCAVDSELGLQLAETCPIGQAELAYQAITMDMNRAGWKVDVALVEEMQRQYIFNQETALMQFRTYYPDAEELNLNSLQQLKAWCLERGVRATSFDEKNVAKLLARINKKLIITAAADPKWAGYMAVRELLETKQILGGSSLKKLQVILDTVGRDGRLRDQYLHCGAGQTLRTTGRSVQMQNLKRLVHVDDVEELFDPTIEWNNDKLAANLRQAFTATDPNGRLIVGDFSSVESRGLAYLAGEEWKLTSYRNGDDLYKVGAAKHFGVLYDQVTKEQRTFGKVGELSCGYGAGSGAVQAFAEGMGVTVSEGEATEIVHGWRATNPKIVEFWESLDRILHSAVENNTTMNHGLPDNLLLQMFTVPAPVSLLRQVPGVRSLRVEIIDNNESIMSRVFHGVHSRGRNVCYFKPSDRKTGDLWRNTFVDPKTKETRTFELYGGKLAGILTQSFCREIFFRTLTKVAVWAEARSDQLQLIGQFHDEIVVDWSPGLATLVAAEEGLHTLMSDPGRFTSFPLAAEVKSGYRYIK
jgi:DNA polymerase bacteriophage-type